jgi:hypothetical protein
VRPDATNAFVTAISSQNIRPALFVEAHFLDGPAYVWSGVGRIDWNGHSWQGLGTLGGISTIEEGSNIQARGITLTLSGIDVSILSEIMLDFQQGLPCLVYLGMFDSGGSLIADPVTAWAGRMDQPMIEMDGQTATLTITCENRLVEMNVAVDKRYTNEQQQLDFPGDRGMEFVASIAEVTVFWGRTPSSHNNT